MALLIMLLVALSTVALLTIAPVSAMTQKRWSGFTVALWVAGVGLFIAWVALTTLAGFQADANQTRGDVFATIGWLIAAAVVALAAVVAQRRARGKAPR
ncbi:hypothetical protein DQ237_14720 [Blastococcus sp. TF02-8]|uniref:hypothetical protein n=1 Tax=Blastococcus sp. TF02-8 TaxID=2250574 RepID=UPI000DEA3BEC|nr:hypothetical protein [Blastococcus sp. TF02-8]RBY95321.1 hypothetical protein DQ237_14720 [Blastococcus sp. TF02-8]